MKRKHRPEPEPQARVVAVRLANLQRRDGESNKAKRGKQNKPRVRGLKRLKEPVICTAANRFHRRYHVRSSGFHQERSAEELRTVSGADRELTAPGTAINPTKITACVEQWGTRRDVDISLEDALQHPDWCPECKAMVESIVMRKTRSEQENVK